MLRYAVIGNPIKHSLSPYIHQAFAHQWGLAIEYHKIEAPLDQFNETVISFVKSGGSGANVTLPFKEQAYLLADEKSRRAQQAKAANTLIFTADKMIADSTDGIGFIRDIINNNGFQIQNKNLLILGAGGAARSILPSLMELAPASLTIANRTLEKAKVLAKEYSSNTKILALSFVGLEDSYDLIINATSAGLTGETLTLPKIIITPQTWCYDLIYAKKLTPFLQWAQAAGAARCIDGIGMLVEQAAESFYLWHKKFPHTKILIDELTGRSL